MYCFSTHKRDTRNIRESLHGIDDSPNGSLVRTVIVLACVSVSFLILCKSVADADFKWLGFYFPFHRLLHFLLLHTNIIVIVIIIDVIFSIFDSFILTALWYSVLCFIFRSFRLSYFTLDFFLSFSVSVSVFFFFHHSFVSFIWSQQRAHNMRLLLLLKIDLA